MSLLFVLGLGVFLIGSGLRGIPNTGIAGSVTMIVGGILVLVSAFIGHIS